MSKFSFAPLEWIYKNFKEDTSNMLIVTGSIGCALSSLAQIGAIYANKKLSAEKKTFLIPQEFLDGAINVGMFLFITLCVKHSLKKLVDCGKFIPKSVKDDMLIKYRDKIGKVDFNIKEPMFNNPKTYDKFNSYKEYVTTAGTLGATVLSCNVLTPLVRNKFASRVQNDYKQNKDNYNLYKNIKYSGDMKI